MKKSNKKRTKRTKLSKADLYKIASEHASNEARRLFTHLAKTKFYPKSIDALEWALQQCHYWAHGAGVRADGQFQGFMNCPFHPCDEIIGTMAELKNDERKYSEIYLREARRKGLL